MEQALEDVVIADFSQLMQGPYATQRLADMGADVIKIEPPGGEYIHETVACGSMYEGESAFGLAMNRNKRSIVLNLKEEKAADIAMDIIERADVLVENFRPGVMERLGFGYDDVTDMNEDIVYVSASGFGSDGPYADRPGQDLLFQAMTGIAAYTGTKDDPPIPCGLTVVDALSAKEVALNTLLALLHRERTGEGQKVETNLLNAAVDLQCQELTAALNMDVEWERSEEGVGTVAREAPYGLYETKDDHVAISTTPIEVIDEVLDLGPLPNHDTSEELYENRDEIHARINDRTMTYESDELLDQLLEADVWSSKVKRYDDLADDPQVQHNDMIVEVEHPSVGTFETTGIPAEFSETPGRIESPPPRVGEHTTEVLTELGYSESEIDGFAADGIIERLND